VPDFRLYSADEAGPDGYPLEWHRTIKHLVRELAGHRCERCKHPYKCGQERPDGGEWSQCDEHCRHRGPQRLDGIDTAACNLTAGELVKEGIAVEAQWRILTVHHLDGVKLNCRWWNLVALCQRDHLRTQRRVMLHRPWLFEHSEWFQPFAAGYYAWSILGQDLDREAVMLRLDELLEIGRTRKPRETAHA
jgi:hypothetical protein